MHTPHLYNIWLTYYFWSFQGSPHSSWQKLVFFFHLWSRLSEMLKRGVPVYLPPVGPYIHVSFSLWKVVSIEVDWPFLFQQLFYSWTPIQWRLLFDVSGYLGWKIKNQLFICSAKGIQCCFDVVASTCCILHKFTLVPFSFS